jgi:hypothetical protein
MPSSTSLMPTACPDKDVLRLIFFLKMQMRPQSVTDYACSNGEHWLLLGSRVQHPGRVISLSCWLNPEEGKNRKGHKTDRKDAEHLADPLLTENKSFPGVPHRRFRADWLD